MILDCARCDGAGEVREPDQADGDIGDLVICPDCGGVGKSGVDRARTGRPTHTDPGPPFDGYCRGEDRPGWDEVAP